MGSALSSRRPAAAPLVSAPAAAPLVSTPAAAPLVSTASLAHRETATDSLLASRVARLRERLGEDAWGEIFAFLLPPDPTRPLWADESAAQRTVEASTTQARLEENWRPDFTHKETRALAHREHRVRIIQKVHSVCLEWRGLPLYSNLRTLCIHARWGGALPVGNLSGLAALEIYAGFHHDRVIPWMKEDFEIPDALRSFSSLRSLTLNCINVAYLPAWFAELPLLEFKYNANSTVEIRFQGGRTFREPFCAWYDDEHALPRSLEAVFFGHCTEPGNLGCVRQLPRLRALGTGAFRSCPPWLHELESLRHVTAYCAGLLEWVPKLRNMRIEAINFDVDQIGYDEDDFLDGLDDFLVNTRCGESLREISLAGNELTVLPESFRGLSITHLDLDRQKISDLPEWIGNLPLVVLKLDDNPVATLPESLSFVTSLRVLVLDGTNLSGPLEETPGDVIIVRSTGNTRYQAIPLAEAAEEIARCDVILRRLSMALPELRFKLNSSYANEDEQMTWWHAACGVDWTDPAFYTSRTT